MLHWCPTDTSPRISVYFMIKGKQKIAFYRLRGPMMPWLGQFDYWAVARGQDADIFGQVRRDSIPLAVHKRL